MGLLAGTTLGENSAMQQRVDYDGSGNAIYIGYAKIGVAADEAEWLIQKFTYNGSNQMTLRQIKQKGAWDSRVTGGYTYA
jgi:hypothetical protein